MIHKQESKFKKVKKKLRRQTLKTLRQYCLNLIYLLQYITHFCKQKKNFLRIKHITYALKTIKQVNETQHFYCSVSLSYMTPKCVYHLVNGIVYYMCGYLFYIANTSLVMTRGPENYIFSFIFNFFCFLFFVNSHTFIFLFYFLSYSFLFFLIL